MTFQKQIAQSLVWRGLYFITVLVMNILLSRYLKAGNAGWIFYLSNNFSFIVIIAGLTMETAVNYYSSRREIDDSELSWFSIGWSLLVSAIVFSGLWVYLKVFKTHSEISDIEFYYYAICYIAGIQMTNFFTVLFYANKDFFLPNFLMIIINVIFIVTLFWQNANSDIDTSFIIQLYFSFFVITGLTLAAAFIFTKQSWKRICFPSFSKISLLVRYAVVALAANVIFFLVYRVDYWFVEKYTSSQELGNYIQVSKLGQMILVIPTIISSVIFPYVAGERTKPAEIKDNIMRIGRITTVLFCLLFLLMVIAGKWLFPFVFGPTFHLMHVPFLLLLPGIWALSNLYILSAYFGGNNKVKINVLGACLALIVILAGDILFIPRYGIFAAAIVSTIGYAVNFMYSFFILQKEHKVSFFDYLSINKEDVKWLISIIHK